MSIGNNMDTCFLCKSSKRDDVKYGEFMTRGEISVHYFCLLLTSNLMQTGRDDEGFLGFLMKDIKAEAKRITAAVCCYCKKPSANISCCAMKCRKAFHLSCGLENNAENQFVGTFKSYCDRHVRGRKRKLRVPSANETCCICYDDLVGAQGRFNLVTMLQAPCCKNGWFHKWCLAEFAKTAGYFFKCPLCNDNKEFRKRLVYKGIFIPDRDAAWELEPNAFSELLERPQECSAIVCTAKNGRKSDSNRNMLIICGTCGSVAIHRFCMTVQMDYFYCDECSPIIATQHSASTINISPSKQNEDDEDEEVDVCGDDDPSPTSTLSAPKPQQSDDDDDEGTVQPRRGTSKNANRILDDDSSHTDSDDFRPMRGRRKKFHRRLYSSDECDSPTPCVAKEKRVLSRDRESFFDSGAETDRSRNSGDKRTNMSPQRVESSNQILPISSRPRRRRCVPLKYTSSDNICIANRTRRRSASSVTNLPTSVESVQGISARRRSTTPIAVTRTIDHLTAESQEELLCKENDTTDGRKCDLETTPPIAHRTRRQSSLHTPISSDLRDNITTPKRQRTMSEDPSKTSPAIQRNLLESHYYTSPRSTIQKSVSTESLNTTPKGKRSRSNSVSSNRSTRSKKIKVILSDDENSGVELSATKKRHMSRDRSPLTTNLRDLYAYLTPAYVKNSEMQKKDVPNEDERLLPGDSSIPDYSRLFNKNKANIQQTKPSDSVKKCPEPDSQIASDISNPAQHTFTQSYSILMGTNADNTKPHKSKKPKHRRSHTFSAQNLPTNQTKIEAFFKRV